MTDSLHDKIAKILRLAANAGTDGERDAALAAAQKMAFKHNLDLSEIDLTEKDSKIGEDKIGEMWDEEWKHTLIQYIAQVNFCRCFFYDYSHIKRGRMSAVLVGRPHNVDVARQMLAYIMPQIDSLVLREVTSRGQLPRYALVSVMQHAINQGYIDYTHLVLANIDEEGVRVRDEAMDRAWHDLVPKLKGDDGLALIMSYTGLTKSYASEIRPFIKRRDLAPEVVEDLKSWRYSFEMACVYRVGTRLQEAFHALKDDAGDEGNALVLRENNALQEYMDDMDLKDSRSSNRKRDHGAWVKGDKAGHGIDLTQRSHLAGNRKEIGS